jgi:hypothetical protein
MTALVTLFCSMKPFEGHNALIQNNALDTWKHLPGVRVILLGNDPGSAEAARGRGFLHIPDIALSEYGTPLLSAMFKAAQAAADTPFVCYINGDILLPVDCAAKVRGISEPFEKFLMVGERWDVDISESLSCENGACDTAELLCRYEGKRHGPTGIDYFAFPTRMIDYMPDFLVGRPGWDLWLLWETKRRGIPVVDASAMLTALHQNHGYRHIPGGDGHSWASGPEAAQYYEILKAYPIDFMSNTILHATHRLTPAGIRSSPSCRRLAWDIRWTALRLYEKLRRVYQRLTDGLS